MTKPTGVLSSSVAIEIAAVSKPMCLLSGNVVVAEAVALNPTVAADVMDAGEKISALLLNRSSRFTSSSSSNRFTSSSPFGLQVHVRCEFIQNPRVFVAC